MRKDSGITLVALVITIIVLLILAGVSISLVVGDNGVLTQAQNASTKTNQASADSAIQLTAISLTSKFMGDIWADDMTAQIWDNVTVSEFETELENNGYTVKKFECCSQDENKMGDGTALEDGESIADGTTTDPKKAYITIYDKSKKPAGGSPETNVGTEYNYKLTYNSKGTGMNVAPVTNADKKTE